MKKNTKMRTAGIMAAAAIATVLGTLGSAYAATADSALYMIVDLTKSLGSSGQITYIDESELTNGVWGTWVRNPVTNRDAVIQSVIWTGVTNGTTYKTDKLVLRRIPAGSYYEGDEGDGNNATNVILTKDQYVGVFEVTQQQWNRVMNDGTGTGTQAKHTVSYYDIRENSDNTAIDPHWPQTNAVGSTSFMGKLRAKTGIDFDLPTEGQWEYACRAETTTYYNDGLATSLDSQLDVLGWYRSSAAQPVGGLLPNAWGLYDMHGNVWEWCLDWYASSPEIGIDPDGADSGSYRLLRGGSWNSTASNCRSAIRNILTPSFRYSSIGFRLVSTLPPLIPITGALIVLR
jgi:formylglycine-generating enzyme required for sulfatase activity